MKDPLPALLILADSPDALTDLCGISLLERLRRVVRKLGFSEAMILSNSVEIMARHAVQSSWHRGEVALKFHERKTEEITIGDVLDCIGATTLPPDGRVLIVSAGFYYDERLLRVLAEAQSESALIDSDPPSVIAVAFGKFRRPFCRPTFLRDFALEPMVFGEKSRRAARQEVTLDTMTGQIASVDAAQEPTYVESMRRNLRPVFFPAPSPERRLLAERFLREATQSGVLDFPALVHAPIEKWIVSHVCRTSITPNQITLGTGILGLSVTLLYAFGHLSVGALLALLVGILDGVDGKLARLKVQTTRMGKGEHLLDYFVEMSWWAALAYHFHATGQVRYAYVIWLIFFACDSLERLAKWSVKRRVGRSIDDVSGFDRFVRYVAGRRNIYTWLFTFCLLTGTPATGFILLCLWGMATAAVHIFRALQIRYTFQNKIA